MHRRANPHRKGYSLASLLLLTAVVAVFLAATCTAWLDPPPDMDPDLIAGCGVGGLVVGLCVGLGIGANQLRPLPGAGLGMLAGMLAGVASGVLLAAPNKMLPVAVGSLVIVLFGLAVRYGSKKP